MLDKVSFILMCLALAIGAVIILGAMWRAKIAAAKQAAALANEESYGRV